jgi:hypothetical protein
LVSRALRTSRAEQQVAAVDRVDDRGAAAEQVRRAAPGGLEAQAAGVPQACAHVLVILAHVEGLAFLGTNVASDSAQSLAGMIAARRRECPDTVCVIVVDLAAFARRGRNSMTRQLSSLLLIAAFGLGFVLGPHPCRAWHAAPKSAHASCHEAGSSAADQQARTDAQEEQEESGDCCKTFCQHTCNMPAIAAAETAAFAFSPDFQPSFEPAGSTLPLFAHPIDHVPLA